jgi:tetratricopeptide (TPR) repeat protein
LDPGHLQACNALGAIYQQLGQLDLAVIQYQQAIRIRPDFAPAHNNLGTLLQKQGKLDQSAVHLRQAIRINPEYSKAHNNLGVTRLAQGRLGEAEDHLRQALTTNPQMAEAHFNLGRVYGRRRQLDQAVAEYEEALRLQHDYELARVNLALVLEGQGKTRQALEHLRRATSSSRASPAAADALAWMLATAADDALRNGQEALRWARSCVKATGGRHAPYLSTLAAAYAEVGDFTEAIRWQQKAIQAAPPSLAATYRERLETLRDGIPLRQEVHR